MSKVSATSSARMLVDRFPMMILLENSQGAVGRYIQSLPMIVTQVKLVCRILWPIAIKCNCFFVETGAKEWGDVKQGGFHEKQSTAIL